MKPTVGRIVHYQSHGSPNGSHPSVPRAAIVTAISGVQTDDAGDELYVDLCVLSPTGMYFDHGAPFSETPKAGHWSWPPRA